MNRKSTENFSLDSFIEAARDEMDDTEYTRAMEEFRASLPVQRTPRQRLWAWGRWTSAIALLVVTLSVLPLLLPGTGGSGAALAQARAWFDHYRTFHLHMTLSQDQQSLSTIQVWSIADGATRIEVPPVTHLFNPEEKVMHTLLPGNQVMSRALSPAELSPSLGQELEWLAELRDFQGAATQLEDHRQINGVQALGWSLELSGGQYTLWADLRDHKPLLLEAVLPGGLKLESHFEFDEPLPESLFQLPD